MCDEDPGEGEPPGELNYIYSYLSIMILGAHFPFAPPFPTTLPFTVPSSSSHLPSLPHPSSSSSHPPTLPHPSSSPSHLPTLPILLVLLIFLPFPALLPLFIFPLDPVLSFSIPCSPSPYTLFTIFFFFFLLLGLYFKLYSTPLHSTSLYSILRHSTPLYSTLLLSTPLYSTLF